MYKLLILIFSAILFSYGRQCTKIEYEIKPNCGTCNGNLWNTKLSSSVECYRPVQLLIYIYTHNV